ncbi:M15 family metallopeptidase [Pseudoglutamicibacter albus]|uniref:M15 family metallopeptidase n=1 Tax=Pseudoglutamicibacter TaxID=1742991 RepID=UPI000C793DC7|nr:MULTISPECIES: M15 family metallopeptidase [Pseudoglutamicibacter]MCT1686874.1 M15 family metallopeptidase [Pseudoglutamicibacter cumminsii]WIK83716.1 M15 family metallopeptidase [Pseudoglutamicibacter albus]
MKGRHAATTARTVPRWALPLGVFLAVLALILVIVLPRSGGQTTNDAETSPAATSPDAKQPAAATASDANKNKPADADKDPSKGSIAGPKISAAPSASESESESASPSESAPSKKPSESDKPSESAEDRSPEIPSDPNNIKVLANKKRPLEPLTYAPKDLVHIGSGQSMRSEAAQAFKKLRNAGAASGVNFHPVSGYRSYNQQAATYNHWRATYGQQHADSVSAAPGTSEHQLGLAVDVSDGICNLRRCFATTNAGQWVARNAHKYGFVVRYPEGKTDVTGYWYEPWHLRYVGTELAGELTSKGLTLEEYYKWKPGK